MNIFDGESTKTRRGKYIRLGNLLLMLIFAVCSFTLMWTAVSSFRQIRTGYENASQGLAAARFTANHLRSAKESISVYYRPDGSLDKLVIGGGSGYEDIITHKGGMLFEAFVHEGSADISGAELFPVDRISLEQSQTGTIRITADSGSGQIITIYAKPSCEAVFYPVKTEE